jgi:hypothetical protein
MSCVRTKLCGHAGTMPNFRPGCWKGRARGIRTPVRWPTWSQPCSIGACRILPCRFWAVITGNMGSPGLGSLLQLTQTGRGGQIGTWSITQRKRFGKKTIRDVRPSRKRCYNEDPNSHLYASHTVQFDRALAERGCTTDPWGTQAPQREQCQGP